MNKSSELSIPTAIGDLPDSILCHILSFLPTKLAATTSVLSKRWKPLWRSVLTLDFDDESFIGPVCFLHIMHSTISLRDTTLPVHLFLFKCCSRYSSCYEINETDVNQIVNFVLQRKIENFNLQLSIYFNNIELPSNILCCGTLKVLKLTNITIGDISHNMDIHLPILKNFHLKRVSFVSHDNIEKLLLGCPILEDLLMKNSCPPFQAKFKALPNLIKARISEFYIPISMVSKAKILRLVPSIGTCYMLLPMFQSLIHLELNFKHIHWYMRWIWLLRMLNYTPKLQNLIIQDTKELDTTNHKCWKDSSIVPECLSSELKTCYIRSYKGTKYNLKFAKYIMENSKVLETMTINSVCSVDINEKHQMFVKLSSCTKGSTTCKLLFD